MYTGHLNNVVYYTYFDTVINFYLIQHSGLGIHAGAQIALCVESPWLSCNEPNAGLFGLSQICEGLFSSWREQGLLF